MAGGSGEPRAGRVACPVARARFDSFIPCKGVAMPLSVFRFAAVLSLAAAGLASAQMTFSIKTNSDFPTLGTDFGYKVGRIEPYLGVSNYSFRLKETRTYTPDQFGDSRTSTAAASVFITSLGVRVGMRDEGVKPYFFANLYKLFTILDMDGNSPEEDDEIEKLYSPFGFGAGFGAEYAVAKNFSVFGEYGFRALFPGSEHTDLNGTQIEKDDLSILVSALSGSAGIRFAF
jgi:opacity protein-like surface antigen